MYKKVFSFTVYKLYIKQDLRLNLSSAKKHKINGDIDITEMFHCKIFARLSRLKQNTTKQIDWQQHGRWDTKHVCQCCPMYLSNGQGVLTSMFYNWPLLLFCNHLLYFSLRALWNVLILQKRDFLKSNIYPTPCSLWSSRAICKVSQFCFRFSKSYDIRTL